MRSLFRLVSLLNVFRHASRGDVRWFATRPLRRRGYRYVRKIR